MPYKVTPTGEIICETPEDAIALSRAIIGGGGSDGNMRNDSQDAVQTNSRWTDSRCREFISLLGGHQKQFLDLILRDAHGKTDNVIRQALGLDSNMALAGVTAGLAKNARKVGMSIDEVYTKKKMNLGDDRVLEYTVVPGFRAIATRVGISKDK